MSGLYKAAITGLGNIGYKFGLTQHPEQGSLSHYAALTSSKSVMSVAGHSPCTAECLAFTEQTAYPAYTDFRELLTKEHPDILCICSPTDQHFSQALQAIEAAVPMVWLEKPPARTCLEVQRLLKVQEAQGNRTTIAVGYQRRYSECYIRLRELFSSNAWSTCKNIELQYSRTLETNGIHIIDVLFYLLNDEDIAIEWVQKTPSDNPSFVLSAQRGTLITVTGVDLPYHSIDIRLICDEARVTIEHGGMTPRIEVKTEHELFPGFYRLKEGSPQQLGQGGFAFSFDTILQDLIDAHAARRAPISNLRTAYKAQALVEQIMERK